MISCHLLIDHIKILFDHMRSNKVLDEMADLSWSNDLTDGASSPGTSLVLVYAGYYHFKDQMKRENRRKYETGDSPAYR